MNEKFRLDGEKVKEWLRKEHRKHSYLTEKLGVSQSLVAQMLCDGHVPQVTTLDRLADLMGITADELLILRAKDKTA